ncbi:MAG: hypothetical protein MAG794_01636 [Gammaproteobacteria bacterium]|nr:hypothetical protein [Gammaproteobacteria bacterium]
MVVTSPPKDHSNSSLPSSQPAKKDNTAIQPGAKRKRKKPTRNEYKNLQKRY